MAFPLRNVGEHVPSNDCGMLSLWNDWSCEPRQAAGDTMVSVVMIPLLSLGGPEMNPFRCDSLCLAAVCRGSGYSPLRARRDAGA
jgi:hypothetical protein